MCRARPGTLRQKKLKTPEWHTWQHLIIHGFSLFHCVLLTQHFAPTPTGICSTFALTLLYKHSSILRAVISRLFSAKKGPLSRFFLAYRSDPSYVGLRTTCPVFRREQILQPLLLLLNWLRGDAPSTDIYSVLGYNI